MRWPAIICLLIAGGLGVLGVGGLTAGESAAATRAITVDGVPMLEVSPVPAPVGAPGVVVAHGFSGSARLMRGFADTLAARGYVVVLPDFTGHGSNPARLPIVDRGASPTLQSDLDTAVAHLRALASVDPTRIGLVGHSMGAHAVTRYATDHGDIAATVAISLGSADELPREPGRPRNLLLLVGAAEFAGFRDAARDGLAAAYPFARFGETSGDPATGTARRAVSVPGVEHVSILYTTATHIEMATWLDAALGVTSDAATHPRDRLVPAALLLVALMVGIVPLASVLLPRAPGSSDLGRPLPGRYAYAGLLGGLALAGFGAGVLPTTRLPLAVGGYAVGFFALVGSCLLAGWAVGRHGEAEAARPGRARRLVAAVVLTAYAVVAVAVPMHLGLLHAVPVGARWWLLPVVLLGAGVLLLGAELVSVGQWWRQPLVLAATAAAMFAAAFTGLGPAFILLVLPLLVVLLAWQAAWSLIVRRRAGPAWLAALVGSVLIAWPIVTTLPLVT